MPQSFSRSLAGRPGARNGALPGPGAAPRLDLPPLPADDRARPPAPAYGQPAPAYGQPAPAYGPAAPVRDGVLGPPGPVRDESLEATAAARGGAFSRPEPPRGSLFAPPAQAGGIAFLPPPATEPAFGRPAPDERHENNGREQAGPADGQGIGWQTHASAADDGHGPVAHAGLGRPVPASELSRSTTPGPAVSEDSVPTAPLPVILPGAASIPRPAQIEAPRGPFEAARPARSTSVTGSIEPPPAGPTTPVPPAPYGPAYGPVPAASAPRKTGSGSPRDDDRMHASAGERPIPDAAHAKLEQIKDLYLTAEAIGEEALTKHFEQVSQRQRELIREFFERSGNEDAH
jgi:hypothetical protein